MEFSSVIKMATSTNSSSFRPGKVPEAITSVYPLGSIFYPTSVIEKDLDQLHHKKMRQLKLDILEALKDSTIEIGKSVFEIIKMPPWFKPEDVINKWSETVQNTFKKTIKQINDKELGLTKEEEKLLEQLRLLKKIEIAIDTGQRNIIKDYLEKYRQYLKESFGTIEKSLYSIRRKFSIIFLESSLNPKFMTSISKAINVTISYFHYLRSELDNVITVLRQIISGRGRIEHFKKDTKAVFARILELDLYQFSILLKLFELQLFMDIWTTKSLDDLFQPRIKYSNTNLDNEYFIAILEELNNLANKLHYKIIEVSRDREKDVPFTFQNNIKEKDQEKMYLISRLIHNL